MTPVSTGTSTSSPIQSVQTSDTARPFLWIVHRFSGCDCSSDEKKIFRKIITYYNGEQAYIRGRTHYGFCSIFMSERRMPMDKIIIALLGAAAVIVQQIFRDDD